MSARTAQKRQRRIDELEAELRALEPLKNLVGPLRDIANPDPHRRDALYQSIVKARRALWLVGEWKGDIEDSVTERAAAVRNLIYDQQQELFALRRLVAKLRGMIDEVGQ